MELFKITFSIAVVTGFLLVAWGFIRKQGKPFSKSERYLGRIAGKIFIITLLIALTIGTFYSCGHNQFKSNEQDRYLHTDN
jgi:cytochrome bd-type quinol oxidase subunit 1